MASPHVLVVGAGIGGLTAAIALAQHGAKVEVFEQASEITDIGAGLQLSPNAMQVLTAIGIDHDIEAAAFEPQYAALRDYKSGKVLMRTEIKPAYQKRYGQKYLNIHRADLLAILKTAAEKAGVMLHLGICADGYEQAGQGVTLVAGSDTHSGDILIGADGIRSKLREIMLGPEDAKFTGQIAWRGLILTKNVPGGTIPPAANNWLGPDRHFVSYYVRGGEFINFVAVEEHDNWTEESWSLEGDIETLRETFKGWDPRLTTLLEACEDCYLWGLFDREPLSTWVDGRVALLGDAAHPMLPFMAQGASMAIEDGWVLAHKVLTSDKCVTDALKSYQSTRYARTSQLQSISRDNAKLYHMRRGIGHSIRNLKFSIATHLPFLLTARLGKIYAYDVTKEYPL